MRYVCDIFTIYSPQDLQIGQIGKGVHIEITIAVQYQRVQVFKEREKLEVLKVIVAKIEELGLRGKLVGQSTGNGAQILVGQ